MYAASSSYDEEEQEAAVLLNEISSLNRSATAKQQIRAQLQVELDAVENQLRSLEAPRRPATTDLEDVPGGGRRCVRRD